MLVFGVQAMSLAVGLSWFLFLYDGFVAVAVIPHTHYGFYSVLNGYIQNITDGVVYLLMYFNVSGCQGCEFVSVACDRVCVLVLTCRHPIGSC